MPGNHSNYYYRLASSMVTYGGVSLCYSWDIGPAHFIVFSTELYFFVQDGIYLPDYQYDWLEKDLEVLLCTNNHR